MTEPPFKTPLSDEFGHLFQALAEQAHEAICIVLEGQLAYANPRLANLSGYDQTALVSGQVALSSLVMPEDWPLVEANIRSRLAGEAEVNHYRFKARHKEGHAIPVELISSRVEFQGQPAVLATILDLSEQVLARNSLEDQLYFMGQLLDAIPSPIFYKDEHGRYQGCNQAFAQSLGMEREEVIGKTVYDLAPEELAQRYDLADRELMHK